MPYWKLYYHFIWATKRRESLILAEFEADLHSIIAKKGIDLGCIVHAIGGVEDHIHLAVSVPPKIALAKFIGEVKGNSSHFVNHTVHPGYKFYWQEEYGVLSFGEKNLPVIVRYILNQKKHHAANNLKDTLEKI